MSHPTGSRSQLCSLCPSHLQVVEAHPDHPPPDLRILHPPATLTAYINAHYSDLSALSSAAFAHIPWAVLLVKAVAQWSAANGGKLPAVYKEKKEVEANDAQTPPSHLPSLPSPISPLQPFHGPPSAAHRQPPATGLLLPTPPVRVRIGQGHH